ncbi:hypothetical protein [Sphingomonas sp. BAUL-RG-20F-R05-02]|uniref:hypothetical protein n=1 Tax=Sphingomonas sp. BAUL-RG-20F-R05-02 TaxID=2914830 RepID=UPI001F59F44B|nr:hypothetical protein [Sphingomonas sp. BAUL-RG-20F-R05-02]
MAAETGSREGCCRLRGKLDLALQAAMRVDADNTKLRRSRADDTEVVAAVPGRQYEMCHTGWQQ